MYRSSLLPCTKAVAYLCFPLLEARTSCEENSSHATFQQVDDQDISSEARQAISCTFLAVGEGATVSPRCSGAKSEQRPRF